VSYNSESTIWETLESVKNQTCRDLELIISDDGSKDKTVEICKQWLSLNSQAFKDVKILTVNNNTGTSYNCNRALKASNGDWLMLLAGDDALMPNAIDTIRDYTKNNPNANWIATRYDPYQEIMDEEHMIIDPRLFDKTILWANYTPLEQLMYVVKRGCPISASSFYFKKDVLIRYGGFNEDYKLIEDVPMMIKLLKNNIKCHYIDISTVKYRKRDIVSSNIFNLEMVRERKDIAKNLRFEYLSGIEKLNIVTKYKLMIGMSRLGLNRNNFFCRIIYLLLMKLISIITWKHGAFPYAYSK